MQVHEYVTKFKDKLLIAVEEAHLLYGDDQEDKLAETIHIIADKLDLTYEQVAIGCTKGYLQEVYGNEFLK